MPLGDPVVKFQETLFLRTPFIPPSFTGSRVTETVSAPTEMYPGFLYGSQF